LPPSAPNTWRWMVRVPNAQACSSVPPLPSGSSRLWSGPAPNPSREIAKLATRTRVIDGRLEDWSGDRRSVGHRVAGIHREGNIAGSSHRIETECESSREPLLLAFRQGMVRDRQDVPQTPLEPQSTVVGASSHGRD